MSIETLFFIVTALVAFIPTIWPMKVEGKNFNWWKGLTLAGRVYIIAFVFFFGTGLYLTITSHNESVVKEITSKERIKSDSLLMSNLTLKVTRLYSSDSLYRSAIKKGGFKYDSLNGVIINPQVNVGKDGSAIVNYASNKGLQAGRDLNVTLEKIWSESQVYNFLVDIKKFADDNKTNKTFFVLPPGVDKYNKVINQLREALEKNGYEVVDLYTTHFGFSNNQYDFKLNGNVIQIDINRL